MYQYEIRLNNLKYQVFERKQNLWLFLNVGLVKWNNWRKLDVDFDTEKEAVHEIKLLMNYNQRNK